jgi:hypothetical protein
MKTLIGYICVVLIFAGLVLPLGSDMTFNYKHDFKYDVKDIKQVDVDSINKRLDSLINFSERNIKYLDHAIKQMR